ncbi:MAG: GNAT family protein [Asticcacaulis sp.]
MSLPFETLSPSLGQHANGFGQSVGKDIPGWQGCRRLPDKALVGRTCRVVPFRPEHAAGLFAAFARDDGRMWTYMPFGPFDDAAMLKTSVKTFMETRGFQTFVIIADDRPLGYASFMRYDPPNGSVEVGGVTFSPALQRTVVATEAMYLMMRHAFANGYRRYEWKCDQLNIPSNKAALRLGFQFEGVFRNAVVSKGRRRDTAWYSVIREDWPANRARLEQWLDPANFDANGKQKTALSALPPPK